MSAFALKKVILISVLTTMDRLADLKKLRLFSWKELKCILNDLESDRNGIYIGSDLPIHLYWTYLLNCGRENQGILPGFDDDGLRRDHVDALAAFTHFCKSSFGQDKNFAFVFKDEITLKRSTLTTVIKCFDGKEYGDDYLTLDVGDELDVMDSPEDGQGWMYGLHVKSIKYGWYPPEYVL